MCTSGLLILRVDDAEAEQWFYARMSLLIMLGASSLVTVWLFARATREISQLGRDATDLRLAQIRKDREEKRQQRPRRPPASLKRGRRRGLRLGHLCLSLAHLRAARYLFPSRANHRFFK